VSLEGDMDVARGRQRSRRILAALVALGAAILALALPGVAWGAAGDLDPSFSGDGILISTHQRQGQGGGPVAIDSSGRIVVASSGFIERYMPNGTPDKSFSGDGQASSPFPPLGTIYSIAIDSRDRIVAAGEAPNPAYPRRVVFAVGRLNVNGAPDPSFSGDGYALTPIGGRNDARAIGVTLDPAGRIVASGGKSKAPGAVFAIARYLPNGSPDTSFSEDGQVQTKFPNVSGASGRQVAIDSKGRIVESGSAGVRFAVARYGPHGGLDHSFSDDGMVTTAMSATGSYGDGVAIDNSDRIVVSGRAYFPDPNAYDSNVALARYRPDGTLDDSFSGNGKVRTSFGWDDGGAAGLAIDDQGRIVVSAWGFDNPDNSNSAFAVGRYTPAGALDPTFSDDGRVKTPISFTSPWSGPRFTGAGGVALDNAGRIVVGGYTQSGPDYRIAVAHYLGG
jgi:uncharacterized delta-60 repeat protein